ncbi:hypothetical protein RB614_24330 [Phytohabitans sp. ZYX-F-186]|uniref:Uncharacterized protein n=1 Tax=Phytohabitans maris TaxID=3071409 RepID=A0ABU0ZKT3_9ACTN|nr:hypothetical protein [Phytohabitans sp. ZYX-F-186]MDQ7907654.1 hypothetical protein [Phytohabitans sp. ZYX-F-186]
MSRATLIPSMVARRVQARTASTTAIEVNAAADVGAYLLGTLVLNPSNLRAGRNRNTVRARNDWPIQPLAGEPPLSPLAHKHIAVLMPGREIVRYGPPAGNLTLAADTEFGAMSLRARCHNCPLWWVAVAGAHAR